MGAPLEIVECKDFACLQTILEVLETEMPATKQVNVLQDTNALAMCVLYQLAPLEFHQTPALTGILGGHEASIRGIALKVTGAPASPLLPTFATRTQLRMALTAARMMIAPLENAGIGLVLDATNSVQTR